MSNSGVADFQLAKRKACQQLGVSESRHLPSNQEIRDALLEYQSLFKSDKQPQQLKQLREVALEAMRFFKSFNPRLAGDVLLGTANEYSAIELHLFADYPEQVDVFLMEENIPCQQKQKRVSYQADSEEYIPVYSFIADDTGVDLLVFPTDGVRRAPNSTIDGKPMKRADYKAVECLLQDIPSR